MPTQRVRQHMKRSCVCLFLLTTVLLAQFEVASVKPHPLDDPNGGISPHPGGFSAIGIPLKLLIQVAWGLKEYQVAGGPDWITTERYDVLAKAPAGMNPTQQEIKPMLQALLTDRFQLRFHRETRDLPAFALVVAKGGVKLKPSGNDKAQTTLSDEHPFADKGNGPLISVGHGFLMGQRLDMQGLADALGQQSDRAVVNKTGMSGEFDLTLKWSPEAGEKDAAGISLFTAIQEQLGLKLESTKSPVELLVIDSAQKPSPN